MAEPGRAESGRQPSVETTASGYAIDRYLPEETPLRRGLAVCLSGGGFRAALFHLGALRRLNEVGLLSQIDTFSSVSGGSILAAHLAEKIKPWPARGMVVGDWEATAEIPFRKVVKRNLRTWPIANRLLPWNWFKNSTGVETLAAQYERNVTRLRLSELPDRPRFLINATDLPFAVNWVFDSHLAGAVRGRMGDYQVGYLRPLPNWPLARAVAASSCFPPIFNPMPLKLRPNEMLGGKYAKGNRDKIVGSIGVSDGGIYDNLGLEPVWKDHAILLVSDGGGSFEPDAARGLFWRLQRYVSVVDSQVRALRKRWLISNFISGQIRGAYWGIGGVANHYYPDARGYSEELVDDTISEVALI